MIVSCSLYCCLVVFGTTVNSDWSFTVLVNLAFYPFNRKLSFNVCALAYLAFVKFLLVKKVI